MFDDPHERDSAAEALLQRTETRRKKLATLLNGKEGRSELGQFFTPAPVASFLAELLDLPESGVFRLLDPGAGVGSLSAAVVARALRERPDIEVAVVAFEIDPDLIPHLRATLEDCRATAHRFGTRVHVDVREQDFIEWAADTISGSLLSEVAPAFSACVMNPPYRKVNNGGADRRALQRVGVTVTNLYAAFLALASRMLDADGQLSAITPRSFANGVYFKSFREFFLSEMAFDRLHVYEQRGYVFADAQVLQENVVFRATRRCPPSTVVLSSSAHGDSEPVTREVPYGDVVHEDDPNMFIRIPVDDDATAVAEYIANLPALLPDLALEVSTGRVVDFRARQHLRTDSAPGTVPLIYPNNLRNGGITWPQPNSKKPSALAANEQTESLLLPNDVYVLVKRFTAKEERRRVVAALITPDDLPAPRVAFENHLNVFHRAGKGLPLDLARGLVAFMNSAVVDRYVRQFSGHTQINAADLRQLRYPSADDLTAAGRELLDTTSLQEHDLFDEVADGRRQALVGSGGAT